ncbi:MAG: Calx-beta domain-containing protein [Geminicoccaceae bacterium]
MLALLGLLVGPAQAGNKPLAGRSGLPWTSGVYTSSSTTRSLEVWRGRPLDVETTFFGNTSWSHMISSAGGLRSKLPTVPGRLIVALGLLPHDQAGKLAECAAGQFDGFIQSIRTSMLNNGALAAATAGRPVMLRLGWEANSVEDGFPWRATGDGTSWAACFRRWVDILNPVTDASSTPPARQKSFTIVWNMANRGSLSFPIDNMWPGDDYVDIVGSQFYDRCPPLPPSNNDAEWARRLTARDAYGNPAGPLAWLSYAKSKGKPYAIPEWGVGGPNDVCAKPGIDNPAFIRKMYDFFQLYAADIAFESYFNGHGYVDDSKGSCELFSPDPAFPDPSSPDYLTYVQRYNPISSATYRALWSQDLSQVTPELSLMALTPSVAEGDDGTTPLNFIVTRTGDPNEAVSASWQVSAGSADATDFVGGVLPAGTVSLAAGETSRTITVPIQGDLREEADETFTVTLGNPSANATLGTSSFVGTILNDDVEAPVLDLTPVNANRWEGDAGVQEFTFLLSRSGGLRSPVTVDWSISGGDVDADDFVGGVLPAGTLSLTAGQTRRYLTIQVQGDTTIEPDEAFAVTLANPGGIATIATATASGLIRNDDAAAPVLSIAAGTLTRAEGQSGGTPLSFVVTRDGDKRPTVTVDWQVVGISADAADFVSGVLPSGTVTLAGGQLAKTVVLQVQADRVIEPDETFSIVLSGATGGASIGTDSVLGTIQNDDVAPPLLAIAATDAAKSEGQSGTTPFTFTVSRSGDVSPAVTARWSVGGTGVAGNDFVGGRLPTGIVSLAANQTSAVITVPVQGDTQAEADEGFTVSLSNLSGEAVLGTASAAGTILNDDDAPALSIAANVASLTEGNSGTTGYVFTVTRTGDASKAVAATWQVAGIGADASDFVGGRLPSGTVSLAVNQTSRTITVPIQGDRAIEPDELFSVILSAPTGGAVLGTTTATGTIQNDDVAPPVLVIAATDAAKIEGQSGTTPFTFTVSRSGDASPAISARWTVVAGSAVAADFVGGRLPSGTVSLAANQTSAVITVPVQGDTQAEADEGFTVALSSPSGAVLGTTSAAGTILNDDDAPALSITANVASLAEGNSGTTGYVFTVSRTGDASQAVGASWQVAGIGADATDFVGGRLPSGTVSLAAGQTSKTITVPIQGDQAIEPDELFSVTLSAPTGGAVLGTAAANGTIQNDDMAPPVLAIAATDAAKIEGQSGTTPFTFAVTRSGDARSAVTARWAVVAGGAIAADFVGGRLPSGIISLAADQTSAVIIVPVQGDTQAEADEGFTVVLSSPTGGAVLGTASAAGTILNDDDAPALSIAANVASLAEGNSGTTGYVFTVSRTGDASQAVGASWQVAGIGADATDFVGGRLPSGTVSLAAGQTSKTITVPIQGDQAIEPDELFSVTLSAPTGGAVLGTAAANGTIQNDDVAPPLLAIAATDAAKSEGQSGTTPFTFTVTRSGDVRAAVTARWTVVAGGAIAADFAGGRLPSGTISLAADQTSAVIIVPVQGDTQAETDEGFAVTLSSPTGGAVLGTASAAGTILNDDDAPALSIAANVASLAEGNSGTTAYAFTVTRTGDASKAVAATWQVAGIGADAADFVGGRLPSGTVSLAVNQTSAVVTVQVQGDGLVEPDELFGVTLSAPSGGAVLGTATATGTIQNDDTAPALSIAANVASLAEGNSGTASYAFTVSRTGDASKAVGASWAVVTTGGADAADFVGGRLPAGSVALGVGETSRTVTVPIQGDTLVEPDEAFAVQLSAPTGGAVITGTSAVGTIRNDDTAPSVLAIAAVSARKAEGNSGSALFTFAVTRSGNLAQATQVDWRVAGTGTAPAGAVDFVGGRLPTGRLSFAAGETRKTISVAVASDSRREDAETFAVMLQNAQPAAQVTAATAIGTILNDDP